MSALSLTVGGRSVRLDHALSLDETVVPRDSSRTASERVSPIGQKLGAYTLSGSRRAMLNCASWDPPTRRLPVRPITLPV